MPVLFEGTPPRVKLNVCGESLYKYGPVMRSASEIRAAGLELRFGKINFIDDALGTYRASEFLQRELTYYDVEGWVSRSRHAGRFERRRCQYSSGLF